METLVLIPQELSLALRPGGARGREASVSVWTSMEIQKGTLLYPFQGTIRIDKLHVYSYVPDHDVSCFDFLTGIGYIEINLIYLYIIKFKSLYKHYNLNKKIIFKYKFIVIILYCY